LAFDCASTGWQLPVDPLLEMQYSLRQRHPERTEVYERQARASAALRSSVAGLRTIAYGPSPRCLLDFLPARQTSAAAAPVFVFIHGGYWRALDRGIFTFLAKPWLERGVHAAFIGYDLAPAVSVSDIAGQVEQAMDWLGKHAPALGVDAARVVLAGHSAGAHLGAWVLGKQQGWQAAGFLGVSGVYDLEPLRQTSVNADIRLDAQEARALSPMWLGVQRATHHLLAFGGAETDGFRGQSLAFAAHLRQQGCAAQALVVPGRTHFDILDELGDAHSALFHQAYALLGADST
jgi:arylformamidase